MLSHMKEKERCFHGNSSGLAAVAKRRAGPYIVLLGGEGPDAHTRGVSLDHAVHLAHVLGGHAQARAHSAHGAVGGSHKGVRP